MISFPLPHTHIYLSMFADDPECLKQIISLHDFNLLQEDLDQLTEVGCMVLNCYYHEINDKFCMLKKLLSGQVNLSVNIYSHRQKDGS